MSDADCAKSTLRKLNGEYQLDKTRLRLAHSASIAGCIVVVLYVFLATFDPEQNLRVALAGAILVISFWCAVNRSLHQITSVKVDDTGVCLLPGEIMIDADSVEAVSVQQNSNGRQVLELALTKPRLLLYYGSAECLWRRARIVLE